VWQPVWRYVQSSVVALGLQRCAQGVLSDGLLSWRCYVIFGKRRWMKWLLAVLIVLDFGARVYNKITHPANWEMTGIGSLSNIALEFVLRWDEELSPSRFLTVYRKLNLYQELIAAWACVFFALNTSMTMSIIYKIM
jgi:hypothetical protein